MSGLDWYAPNPQAVGIEIRRSPDSFHTAAELATPTEADDATNYEIGNMFGVLDAAAPVHVVGLRVWSAGDDTGLTGRKGRLWQVADEGEVVNELLAETDLPDDMPAGWSSYYFPHPVEVRSLADENWYTVSYSTNGFYGNVWDALNGSPDDGVIQYPANNTGANSAGSGRFTTTQGNVPTTASHAFYVDVLYIP